MESVAEPPKPPKTSVAKVLTNSILQSLAEELHSPECQQQLKVNVITPLIRLIYENMFPYVMTVCAVMLIIMLASLCTCAMFALFFFRST
jgi:hypothetical protein